MKRQERGEEKEERSEKTQERRVMNNKVGDEGGERGKSAEEG